MTGKKIEVLHIVGGGIKDKLLCQFTSDSIGKKVIAGPVEATAMGNIMIQAISAKQIANVAEGRKIIGNSVELAIYRPQQHEVWNEKYQQNKHIFES